MRFASRLLRSAALNPEGVALAAATTAWAQNKGIKDL